MQNILSRSFAVYTAHWDHLTYSSSISLVKKPVKISKPSVNFHSFAFSPIILLELCMIL